MPKIALLTQRPSRKYMYRRQTALRRALWVLAVMTAVAVFADFLANDRPLAARYCQRWHAPILEDYAARLHLLPPDTAVIFLDWQTAPCEWAIWTPIPYHPRNLDTRVLHASPFGRQAVADLHHRHWLGTDAVGRDVAAGLLHGTRIALAVGLLSMSLAFVVGVALGGLAGFFGDDGLRPPLRWVVVMPLFATMGGYYGFFLRRFAWVDAATALDHFAQFCFGAAIMGGFVAIGLGLVRGLGVWRVLEQRVSLPLDLFISRLIELFKSIPVMMLLMASLAVLKPSIGSVVSIVAMVSWASVARFVRAELLRIRALTYIEAARSMGFSEGRLLLRHALPNALSPAMVVVAFGVAAAILTEATLSFLGLGLPPEILTWGKMLAEARRSPSDWWLAVFPGAAVFATVRLFHVIGEAIGGTERD